MFQRKTLPTLLSLVRVFGLALGLVSPAAFALGNDDSQPVYIESDFADVDQAKHVVVYRGNVKIRQGSLGIWGDRVTLYTNADSKLVKAFADAKAGGLARFKQNPDDGGEQIWGEGERLEYWPQEHLLKIFGRGKLWQGGDVFTSDSIVYDTAKELLVGGDPKTSGGGKPAGRVHMTIQPKTAQ